MRTCNGCGKKNDRVRGCCDHAEVEDLCDLCYGNNKGERHNKTHTGQVQRR